MVSLVCPINSCLSQPGRLRHLQGVFTRAGKAKWNGVDADIGLSLFGSQKVELMHRANHHYFAAALQEVTAESLNGGFEAVIAEQSAS